VDAELREELAKLYAQGASTAQDARMAAERSKEAAHGVSRLEGRVGVLERHVFGAAPPSDPPAAPLLRQVSEQDMEHDALKAHVIVLDTKVDTLTKMQEEQNEMLRTISKAVGGFFGSPTVQRIGALVGALVLAWLTAKTQGVLK
jgi:hypothetical protein